MDAPVLAQTRAIALTRIRRERVLPVRGEVSATIGSRVDPVDVIAQSPGAGHLRPIPLARYMHLSETTLPKYLLKKPGDEIIPREIIASRPELFGTLVRIYRAPGAGKIAALQGIWMTLELSGAPVELKALYRGVVVNVMPRLGVVIEAMGSLVQGLWGGGGEGYGVLKKMVQEPGEALTEDKIDMSARGAILLAGAGISEEGLRRAAQEHAAGVIVGALLPSLRQVVIELGLPTIVTEGFGERAMAAPIFELLASHHGEETSLNTVTVARGGAIRPEIFTPAISTVGAPLNAEPIAPLTAEVGARVRILRAPHEGRIGKITGTPKLPQVLESGTTAWGAEIELNGGGQAFVPWHNLELIG